MFCAHCFSSKKIRRNEHATKQTLMIQGTTSDAGKSILVTAICRWLKRQGVQVAPFKPQNMALNSAVTENSGEISRAQAVQAYASGLAPHTDMNPVLLKPNSDIGAQIIIHGHAIGNMDASNYHDYKKIARQAVMESHSRLESKYDRIIAEGAGSPAEINLRDSDIANMGFAQAIDCPVILIADIDRGGVFAHIIGTLALLSEDEQARICGFVINRFRGDIALLQPGLKWLEQYTCKPVLGVLPFLHGLHVDAEDALPDESKTAKQLNPEQLQIVVPAIPHICNHTDFDPLRLHPQINLRYVGPGKQIPAADLIILPGSKNVRADLDWLRKLDWDVAIMKHLRFSGKVIGICGGFQMLGGLINDPHGLEGDKGSSEGLKLFDMDTKLVPDKQLRHVQGTLSFGHTPVTGYEIHTGITTYNESYNPAVFLPQGTDGAISPDGQIFGTYLHGLFESSAACSAILAWAGLKNNQKLDYPILREQAINRLADTITQHIDTRKLCDILDLTITPE